MLVLLLALLPLDLAAVGVPSAAGGLRLEAVLEGRRVGARLTNTGTTPLEVLVGFSCGGPEPFVAIVDGVERSFQTGTIICSGNAMRIENLAPGASRRVLSETMILDGAAHELAVRYAYPERGVARLWHGALHSPPLRVPSSSLDVSLRAAPGAVAGTLDVEITHRWHGPTPLRFLSRWTGVCASPAESLVVDGQARGFVEGACDGPAAGITETLAPGGAFVNRATIHLPAGLHRVRARYRVGAGEYRSVGGDAGNIGDFHGDVESPEIEASVR